MYIYENTDWPNFRWDSEKLITLLSSVRNLQGRVLGSVGALGFELKNQANLETLTLDVIKTSEIEGEMLDTDQVRSSLARRLGLEISGLVHSDRNVDGIVDMMLDATGNYELPLDKNRLFSWHAALFPGGYSGMYKVTTGKWREDTTGPMQVVSGPMGRETVHYQAPEAGGIEKEMYCLLEWIGEKQDIDPVIKAAVAHLWFVTLHPFEDGNGRIARAITDMLLAQSDGQSYRFYSMSTQIRKERKAYYDILEKTQKGSLNITNWLEWFLTCLLRALENSELVLHRILFKHNFWMVNTSHFINTRQRKILNLLMDNFEGNLTSTKWAKICSCSQDTAIRDIHDLIEKGILCKLPAGGRSTCYGLFREGGFGISTSSVQRSAQPPGVAF